MKRASLIFVRPREIAIREEEFALPRRGEVRVRTRCSAISAGTELIFYRGHISAGLSADPAIGEMRTDARHSLKYGYACAGEVEEVGADVARDWEGRMVVVLHPHESGFCVPVERLLPVPDGLPVEDAVFLPFMETAVNLVMDGEPAIGERVAVFGQGVIGLLVTALLSRFPLRHLAALDRHAMRRERSREMGAKIRIDPGVSDVAARLQGLFNDGADLVYELSGDPGTLNDAMRVAGYGGRIVVGSWYGTRQTALDLGGRFHRSRIRLIGSQVSSIDPRWTGRWTKKRRFETAFEMLREIRPSSILVTHRFPIGEASVAYRLLDERPEDALQVLLTYS